MRLFVSWWKISSMEESFFSQIYETCFQKRLELNFSIWNSMFTDPRSMYFMWNHFKLSLKKIRPQLKCLCQSQPQKIGSREIELPLDTYCFCSSRRIKEWNKNHRWFKATQTLFLRTHLILANCLRIRLIKFKSKRMTQMVFCFQ